MRYGSAMSDDDAPPSNLVPLHPRDPARRLDGRWAPGHAPTPGGGRPRVADELRVYQAIRRGIPDETIEEVCARLRRDVCDKDPDIAHRAVALLLKAMERLIPSEEVRLRLQASLEAAEARDAEPKPDFERLSKDELRTFLELSRKVRGG